MVLPDMIEKKDGAITIVSSVGGLLGTSEIGVYNISKAADFQIARNLAVEFSQYNIRANCIAPGLIKTDFARALWENPSISRRQSENLPMRRLGEPDDIAGAAVFLSSQAARYMTGQSIVVDGGMVIV
jgi:NAD(P)-dependent dehydrogenase (short-subunit alcohol dehydrogenase family)